MTAAEPSETNDQSPPLLLEIMDSSRNYFQYIGLQIDKKSKSLILSFLPGKIYRETLTSKRKTPISLMEVFDKTETKLE